MILNMRGMIFDSTQWTSSKGKYGASCTIVSPEQKKTISINTDSEMTGELMLKNEGLIVDVDMDIVTNRFGTTVKILKMEVVSQAVGSK